jgi:hypothetical protein
MARITFEVVDPSGVRTTVATGQADIIAMERKFDISAASLATSARQEWVNFLAYNAMRRAGQTSLDFDAWIEAFEVEEANVPKEQAEQQDLSPA